MCVFATGVSGRRTLACGLFPHFYNFDPLIVVPLFGFGGIPAAKEGGRKAKHDYYIRQHQSGAHLRLGPVIWSGVAFANGNKTYGKSKKWIAPVGQ